MTKKIKLTKAAVDRLTAPDPSGKQQLYWFDGMPGFGVLVSGTTDAMSYVVQRSLKGKTRRLTVGRVGVGHTITSATERARELLVQFDRGEDPKVEEARERRERERQEAERKALTETTLLKVFTDYKAIRTDLRPKTIAEYERHLKYLEAWRRLPLASITREMVERRHRDIPNEIARGVYAEASKFHKGRTSDGHLTANAVMRTFKLLYTFAEDRAPDLSPLPKNPVRLKKQWFTEKPRETVIPDDKLPAFYQAAEQLTNGVARDYVLLLLFSGMRRSEASALKWRYINFDRLAISLPAELTKTGRPLDLPLTDMLRFILLRRRNEQLAALAAVNASLDPDGWVFPADSESGHIEEPASPLATIARRSGVAVAAHDLRRTFATIGNEVVGRDRIKPLLNHARSQDVTERHYVQNRLEAMRESAHKVCNRIRELCDAPEPFQRQRGAPAGS